MFIVLPRPPSRLDRQPTTNLVVSTVYDVHGQPIAKFTPKEVVFLWSDSSAVQALPKRRGLRFYAHGGIDVFAIVRASFTNLRRGGVHEGASTLTHNRARIFPDLERTFAQDPRGDPRLRVEKPYQDEILYLYLNQVYSATATTASRRRAGTISGRAWRGSPWPSGAARVSQVAERNSPYRFFRRPGKTTRVPAGCSRKGSSQGGLPEALETPSA
jgi:hypothetical protein